MSNYHTTALVVSFDDNYIPYAKFLLSSLNKYAPKEIEFFLLTPIETEIEELELSIILGERKSSHIPIDYHGLNKDLPVLGHFTLSMYGRLFIPELLPKRIKQSLYLDIDVLVRGSLNELFELPLVKPIAAVAAKSACDHLSLPIDASSTFFSGLLLINHSEWRSNQILSRCLDIINSDKEVLTYPDNDLLIIVCNTPIKRNWTEISPKYNYMSYWENEKSYKIQSPLIIHFPGSDKPWNSPFGGKYARQWRKEFRNLYPDFRLPIKVYFDYFYRRSISLLYRTLVFPSTRWIRKLQSAKPK